MMNLRMRETENVETVETVDCPLCSTRFDPAAGLSKCPECPAHPGGACHAVCCPNCSYSFIPPQHSALARATIRVLRRIGIAVSTHRKTGGTPTLGEFPRGARVRIGHFDESLDEQTRLRLLAYGLVPGEWVTIVQHRPATLLRIEHTEIAIESDIAKKIPVWREEE
ncbi:MAG: ferrous iron transport protein A [Betaproteobacteria bacterium]|nr:ferrous iron transport protein A [Betaproteobacteria bacterium]